jgi:AraC family transcriptional regulator of arabinose operon
MMIKVLAIGSSVNYPDRPKNDIYANKTGFGHWVFMHFTTPFKVKTPQGIIVRNAGDFLINSPNYPQWHQGQRCCFKNDWFHFDGEEISNFLNTYKIPLDIPFTCFQESRVLNILQDIQREHILNDQFKREKQDYLVKVLFIELARSIQNQNTNSLSEREKELLPYFQEMRIKVHQNMEQPWTVSDMANQLSLSTNRFAVLYKYFFSISPLQDLLQFRLNRASMLLLNQTGKVSSISNECGFFSEQYFCRVFKKYYRMSPSEYRKLQAAPENSKYSL